MTEKNNDTNQPREGSLPLIIVDPSLPSLKDDPIIVQRAEDAKAFIARVGLPKQFMLNKEK